MRTLVGQLLCTLLLGSAAAAHAAQPGAFEVTETRSALGSAQPKPPRTKNRCIGPALIDRQGFLYPDQLLAAHFKSCKVTRSKANGKQSKEWTVACGRSLTAEAAQVNRGSNFDLTVDAKLFGSLKQTLRYQARSLGRACTEDDSPLE
ncbi:MAG: hypothetical protein ACN6O3_18475 [Comamonas sp.]